MTYLNNKYPKTIYQTSGENQTIQVSTRKPTLDDILIWIANELAEANRLKALELQDRFKRSPLLDEVLNQ